MMGEALKPSFFVDILCSLLPSVRRRGVGGEVKKTCRIHVELLWQLLYCLFAIYLYMV
jgi:hypothetical protein